MNDEGFREIQLNGKQLIFLFMAVAVVLVVTFLFGVLTGRGVREGAATAQIASNDITPDPGLTPVADRAAPPAAAGAPESQAPAAAQPAEELSYAERLLRDTAPEEKLKETAAPEPAASAPVVQEPVAQPAPDASARQAPPSPEASARQAKPPPPPPPAPKDTAPAIVLPAGRSAQPRSVPAPVAAAPEADPSGPGFAVQVAAYRDRRDADTLAKQLTAKGYPAFVMDPVKGTSTALFRVRVGKYKTLKDAQAIEARLQSSEQLTNAWIAR